MPHSLILSVAVATLFLRSLWCSPIFKRHSYVSGQTAVETLITFAFRDKDADLVKLWLDLDGVLAKDTLEGSKSLACSLRDVSGQQVVVTTRALWVPFQENLSHGVTTMATLDCPNEDWASHVAVMQGGRVVSTEVQIEDLVTERQGAVAMCSQPLHTQRDWLPDWVRHYAKRGVSKIFLHVPVGPHVEGLFGSEREYWVNESLMLDERSPEVVGTLPLKTFHHDQVEWHEYHPSPRALFYDEMWVFNACAYRCRKAYDYVFTVDIDEFFVSTSKTMIPNFLSLHLPSYAASLSVWQLYYPQHCRISVTADYASDFVLRTPNISQEKSILRPHAVNLTHIHGIIAVTTEWHAKQTAAHPDLTVRNISQVFIDVSAGYLKHIRPVWREDDEFPCAFGPGVRSRFRYDLLELEH